ncbi:hypothetical protein I79_022908 [Cricetulus griseus]|uniref:Uncharacterized protein n=1 Tax=Cricetulus griseus TaxID=10029 RepID=G3IGJ1_CRIGR|nr:hypothetical protein I79_022908 [Cricetulus griseus]
MACVVVHIRSNNYDTTLDHSRQYKRGSEQGREKESLMLGKHGFHTPCSAHRKLHGNLGAAGF